MNHIAPSYHEEASQRTPCMLVLDISGSMSNRQSNTKASGIDELNRGLLVLRDALQDDEAALYRVQLGIVTVGGPRDEARLMLDWTDAADFEPPTLTAGGRTPLAQGMSLALHHVELHKQTLRNAGVAYTRPWIMVISDGDPTDAESMWQSAARDCLDAERRKRCVIYPIGVEGANLAKLQQLSNTQAKSLSAARFAEYFQWLSASLSMVSSSLDGESVVLDASSPWEAVSRDRDL